MGSIALPPTLSSEGFKVLNDATTFHQVKTVHQVAETRSSHDRLVDANMASREHYLYYGVRIVDWTIHF